MTTYYRPEFKRKLTGGERTVLMIPLNVVVVARVSGVVDGKRLAGVLDSLRRRHSLLGVRVSIEKDHQAWFLTEDVPDVKVNLIPRLNEGQWLEVILDECRTSFPLDTGPLIRFSLLHSSEESELVVCAHHAICDGMSLTYLIRDILQHLAEPDREIEILPVPPAITMETVPSPPSTNFVASGVIGLVNWVWARHDPSFDITDMQQLHEEFWRQNDDARVLAWELSRDETEALVSRCHAENVTVNSALWTAFLAAQYEIQGRQDVYRASAGMAVSTRDKLSVPVGEAFGFYASSFTSQLEYDPRQSFWDMARIFHQTIVKSLEDTDIFKALSADALHPTLLDSLYFDKYGLFESKISAWMVKQMNWQGTSYGYSITNVGRMGIPTDYGSIQLEALYGPYVYSDVNEKTVGVVTVGDKATFVMSYNEANVGTGTAEDIRDAAMKHLKYSAGSE